MIIYNVTVNVEDSIHDDWLEWMQEKHIPDMIGTGLFISHRFMRILTRQPGETGVTYAIQYHLKSMDDYNEYQQNHAPALQKETQERYEGRFFAFRTLMEEVW